MLGTERLAETQEVLLQHLAVKDASLFAKVAQSLGRIGDEQALEQLEQIDVPTDSLAKRRLEFAQSLLAYRLRLNRHLIALPTDADLVEMTNGIPSIVETAEIETVRKALQDARKDLPAVSLTEEGAVKLVCRSNELLLVFTAEFRQPEVLRTIQNQSALPLVMLKNGLSLQRYFLDTYFFTHPIRDRVEVALLGTRPTGELTYAGRIQISENELTFTRSEERRVGKECRSRWSPYH